ncbi:MAG: T9SS type A sorting domain-containing protein [Crocinitomicaceae bacterium]|nr:T9SS type A sorting domain-containing protein [Crocinitomicaceae bacterium]
MKFLSIVCFLLIGLNASAQAFSFVDTITILDKTTDESPAHWYLEIFNDVGVDTTLRWKSSFDPNLPPQWVITFDDQNNFYNPVNNGDSADFTLYAAPAFPQKLIIGGILNNTPGTASVYFDIYDPANPSYVQTIEYRFIISMGSGTWGTEELNEEEQWFTQSGRSFTFIDKFNSNEVVLYDNSGRQILSKDIQSNQLEISSNIPSGIYFLTTKINNSFYSTRIIL